MGRGGIVQPTFNGVRRRQITFANAPISYVVMNNWLDGFAFHTDFGIGTLFASGIASLVIAGLTVSYQSIRAALANPVVSLRSD